MVRITQHLEKRAHVERGDFVISMRSFQGGLERAWAKGCIRSSYVVLKPSPAAHVGYFAHLFKCIDYIRALQATSNFIRDGQDLNFTNFCLVDLPLAPMEEQAAIAQFLDLANRKINHFIRNRRRLIEVLNEQKQAIINRAVTRGLDPNVRLKPSGIEWLGDVPEHWRSVRLKHVSRVQTGITLGKNYMGQKVEERPYLRVANVQTGRLDLRTVKTVAVPPSEIVGSELKPGDVLMTEGGDIDKLGRGCVWRGEIRGCLHQNHIFAVRPDQRHLLSDYLVPLMASRHGRTYFQLTAKQTTNLACTNSTTLGEFPLVLPRPDEQRQILAAVAIHTLALDAAIDRAQHEIDLIREYRTRFIVDVVTGKLDVRDLAPAPGDEISEADDLAEGIDDEAMQRDDESELVEETADADD